jgi:hypothetical protein
MSTKVTFKKSFQSYNPGDGAAFTLDKAIQLVGQGLADFSDPSDLAANQVAVTAATPTPLVACDTFVQTAADGSDPTVVVRRRDGK